MIDLELSWRAAAVSAGVLGVSVAVLRRVQRPRVSGKALFAEETALILGLFALWQYAGTFSVLSPDGALARSRWIWHVQHLMHLPSETTIQHFFLPYPLLIEFLNLYYAALHFPVLIGCMIWLFVRQRERYRRVRTTLVAFTGLSLLIQLIPVAPPRMLPETHLIDTAVLYGQSVYATHTGFEADQLSAMPSVHVGWAILVAVVIIGAARSRWRWLALLYPVMTMLAVVVTANHFWLDGIAAGLLLAAVLAVQAGGRRLLEMRSNSGLLPDSQMCDHLGNTGHSGTGGSNGRYGSVRNDDRAPAGRDRTS